MGRPAKDGKALNLYIEAEIADRLEQYCDDTGITKTAAIERILESYFDDRDEKIKKTGERKLL